MCKQMLFRPWWFSWTSLYIIYIIYFCYFDTLLLRHSWLAFSSLKRGENNKTLFIIPTISYVSLTNPLLGSSCRLPSKPPNDNTKTKLKNNSTTTTQEARSRASTTSQVLKGINQLLWTLPPLYRMSATLFMLVSRLITPHTQRALPQRKWVHSRFLSWM